MPLNVVDFRFAGDGVSGGVGVRGQATDIASEATATWGLRRSDVELLANPLGHGRVGGACVQGLLLEEFGISLR